MADADAAEWEPASGRARFDAARYWRMFPVRLAAGLLVMAAALAPQVWLAYRPEPVSLDETGRFAPAAARLGREILTVESPSIGEDGLLFSHKGREGEVVDLHADSAQLEGETLMNFSEKNPPTGFSRLDFVTARPAAPSPGKPCRTFVEVRVDPHKPPAALHFFQKDAPGGEAWRELSLKADGNLTVVVNTDMPDDGDERAPGCAKLLKIAPGFSSAVAGISNVSVIAEAGSAVQFRFNPVTPKDSLWGGPDGFYNPFSFGSRVPPTLGARAVEVEALDKKAPTPSLGARSPEGGDPLVVESLLVGSDKLQAKVSGVGLVRLNGEDYADPYGRVRRHAGASLLLALADVALLAWVVHLIFGRRRPPAP